MKHYKLPNKQRGFWQFALPIAASVISAAGSFFGAKTAAQGQEKTNEENIMLNRENRDFQERMSNTEVQRHVQDLQAAGLNPMLAYSTSGNTPNTTAAQVENPDQSYEGFGRGISSAAQVALQTAQLNANIENVRADTATKLANAKLLEQNTENARYQTAITANTASQVGVANQQQWYDLQQTRKQIENLIADTNIKDLNQRQMQALMPLLIREQELQNQLRSLDIPEAEVNAEWYKKTGLLGKGLETGKDLLNMILPAHKIFSNPQKTFEAPTTRYEPRLRSIPRITR